MDKLSIIIPVFNEEKTVLELIKKVKGVKLPIKKEIIVIDDCSSDNSKNILLTIKGIRLISHEKNLGKTAAIKTGINHSNGDIIIIQDADLEYDPNDYVNLIKPILENKALVVYGSRELNKNNLKHSGKLFYIGGLSLTILANLLYPSLYISDEPTCYKVFKSEILKDIDIKSNGFDFCPEVTAKIAKKQINIYEVPISYSPRTKKEGKKINFKDGLKCAWTLIKFRFID